MDHVLSPPPLQGNGEQKEGDVLFGGTEVSALLISLVAGSRGRRQSRNNSLGRPSPFAQTLFNLPAGEG